MSSAEQEEACRDYCRIRELEPSDVFHDQASQRDKFGRMIEATTSTETPYAAVVVKKMHRFAVSLNETIEYQDRFRRNGVRVLSATEKGVEG